MYLLSNMANVGIHVSFRRVVHLEPFDDPWLFWLELLHCPVLEGETAWNKAQIHREPRQT